MHPVAGELLLTLRHIAQLDTEGRAEVAKDVLEVVDTMPSLTRYRDVVLDLLEAEDRFHHPED